MKKGSYVMSTIKVDELGSGFEFGVKVDGLRKQDLGNESIKEQLRFLFDSYGLIIFENIEPTDAMQIELSNIFGTLKEHPIPTVPRAKIDNHPGIIKIATIPEDPNIIRVNGEELTHWLPWHFDHSYNDKLNRAGVLRPITIAPEDGMTGFVDGIELYNSVSQDVIRKLEGKYVLYLLDPLFTRYRFGMPDSLEVIRLQQVRYDTAEHIKDRPRAAHPAIWTRPDGRKVLHLSPFMSMGIEGEEQPSQLEEYSKICDEILRAINPYYHRWKPTDMLIWDNCRMLHCSTGINPLYQRVMHRTTIEGDYGLGRFESQQMGAA